MAERKSAKKISIDAQKGALARAEKLTAEQRSDIARKAAEARWDAGSTLPKQTHPGELKVGDRILSCSVLDNNLRVISSRGMHDIMGVSRGGPSSSAQQATSIGGALLPRFLATNSIKAFISSELMAALATPIQYRPLHGGRSAYGYEARLLPQVCAAIIDADRKGNLAPHQKPLADTAAILNNAFAQVGVIALVDEATGYQEVRAKNELARLLEEYVQEEYRKWIKTFPDEFFKQVFRLYNWEYKPGIAKRPGAVGQFIVKYIYEQLPDGVLDELRKLNPASENGHRKYKHFQFLTPDTGSTHLNTQITKVLTLMQASDNIDDLKRSFEKVFGPLDKPSLANQDKKASKVALEVDQFFTRQPLPFDEGEI